MTTPMTVTPVDIAAWIAAAAGALSAAIAAVQIWLSRRDANYRTTVELIGAMAPKLEAVMAIDLPTTRAEIEIAYTQSKPLSADGMTYLALLHSLELLADARAHGGVDASMADRFLKGLTVKEVVPLGFLSKLQELQNDAGAFGELRKLITSYKPTDRRVIR